MRESLGVIVANLQRAGCAACVSGVRSTSQSSFVTVSFFDEDGQPYKVDNLPVDQRFTFRFPIPDCPHAANTCASPPPRARRRRAEKWRF